MMLHRSKCHRVTCVVVVVVSVVALDPCTSVCRRLRDVVWVPQDVLFGVRRHSQWISLIKRSKLFGEINSFHLLFNSLSLFFFPFSCSFPEMCFRLVLPLQELL